MHQIETTESVLANHLIQIQNWDIKDTPGLLNRMKQLWIGGDSAIEQTWDVKKDKQQPLLMLSLHTGGWSHNEQLIDALKCHKLFFLMWWCKTERGGHYYFEINFSQIGFTVVSKYCSQQNISRQAINQNPDNKYDWIVISQNKRLIRKKETITQL